MDSDGKVSYYDGIHYHNMNAFTKSGVTPVMQIASFQSSFWQLTDGQLQIYSNDSNQFKTVPLPGAAVDLAHDNHSLYVTTANATFRISAETLSAEKVSEKAYERLFNGYDSVLGLYDGKLFSLNNGQDILMLGTLDVTIARAYGDTIWVGSTNGLARYDDGILVATYLPTLPVFDIEVNQEGVWAATSAGLYLGKAHLGQTGEFMPIDGKFDDRFSFSGRYVSDIELSDKGELWIATESGLNFRPPMAQDILRFPLYALSPNRNDEEFSALVPWRDKYLVAARYKLVTLNSDLSPLQSVKLDVEVESMAVLNDILWIGSASGLRGYNPQTLQPIDRILPVKLKRLAVDAIISDSHSLWISSGANLYRFWPSTETVIDFGNDWAGSIDTSLTSVVDMDEKGTWLGTTNGLYLYFDGRFVPTLSREDVGRVNSLHAINASTLWLATSKGIFKYGGAGEMSSAFHFSGRTEEVVTCLTASNAQVFAITNMGTYAVGTETEALSFAPQIKHRNHLSSRHYACTTDNNRMIMAGDEGVFSIPLPVLEIMMSGERHNPTTGAIHLNGHPWRFNISPTEPLEVPNGASLMVEVGQLPFNQFSEVVYRLEGESHSEWYATKDHRLVFSALESGDYTLLIKLKEGAKETAEFQLMRIQVKSSWYERVGVMVALLLLFALMLIASYRRKHAAVREQNRQLRSTVHRKVAVIDKQQSDVCRSNVLVQTQQFIECFDAEVEYDESTPDKAAVAGVQTQKDSETWARSVLSEIQYNFHDPDYSLAILAKTLYSSERSLQRRFRQEFNATFKDLLIATRLENAKRMLCQGDKITDVAVSCGFNEPSYFTKSFKARFGVTPSQFRDGCEALEEKKKSVV
ncbi:AraC family transcriptional regulator [Enterovibrio paralichthyis]|uniref:AraC family transcriptional regulator n=1 Tax=Enterovibrio paralichthyis TaxID=2853805 RepID=UPI001C4546D2|nr:AraC family transcriptional regulator [Enterovibrio paralichthyis]MBV7299643.1 helix-turn-helix domain-containing protein [Enterovibrio paralichthyis]